VNIKNILAHKPPGNIVIAWSLNSEKIAGEEEIGAPPVHDRIQAARLVSQAGYRVGFHFDPIIFSEGWEDGYGEMIESVMAQIDRKKIAWISLGSLRFPPALKPVIQKRFPQTKIIYDEFIIGKDGKLRYSKPLRRWLFQRIVGDLKKAGGGEIPVYFCMESSDLWMNVLKKTPTLPLGVDGF
jgi:spore photoproduct lyase